MKALADALATTVAVVHKKDVLIDTLNDFLEDALNELQDERDALAAANEKSAKLTDQLAQLTAENERLRAEAWADRVLAHGTTPPRVPQPDPKAE